jgi:hypothetical protein
MNRKGEPKTRHGYNSVHGRKSEYNSWYAMKQRCFSPNTINYHNYGGKGITVCDRWLDFRNFIADMGDKPSSRHSLERIDSSGNYEPNNCRWASRLEQNRNTSRNVFVEYNGERVCVGELAARYNISNNILLKRVKRGWSMERALSSPTRIYKFT